MRRSQKFTFVKSLLVVVLSMSLLTLLGGGGALAQTITAKINDATKSGTSLENAISNTALDQITSIEVTAGKVTAADWSYLYAKKDRMTALKRFVVTDAVTTVDNITTGSTGVIKVAQKDSKNNFFWDIKIVGGSPLSSSVEYCEIHKLKKIEKNGFSEVGELRVAVLPDLEEIGDFGFAEHGMLRVVIAPKLKKVGDYGFYNCKALQLIRLGDEPPQLAIGTNPADGTPNEYANVFGVDTDVYCILQIYKNGAPLEGTDLDAVRTKYFAVKDGRPNGKVWNEAKPSENDPKYQEYLKTTPDDMWFGWHFGSFARIDVVQQPGGKIKVVPQYYQVKGEKVHVNITPEKGKALDQLTYTPTKGGTPVAIDETFKMPGFAITISATFKSKELMGKIKAADGTVYTNENAGNLANLFYDNEGRPFEAIRDEKGKLDLLKVAQIRITGGYFAKSDWNWLKVNSANFAKLKSFIIDDTTSQVDDIADDNEYDGYFFKGDHGALEELELHKLKKIGKAAFTNCTLLKRISAPDVESVGESAFDTNLSLVEVNLPKVKNLGKASFNNCRTLKTLSFPQLESLIGGAAYNPASPVTNSTFLDCRSLRSIDLGKVEYIPTETFAKCISLQEVKAESVKVVGDKAFYDEDQPCVNLKSITMPKLTEIGLSAFAACRSLAQLILSVNPPVVKKDAANPSPFNKCVAQDMIFFVDATGSVITSGEALTNAVTAYKAVDDGNTSDSKWFGWNLPTDALHQIKIDPALSNGRVVSTPSGYAPQGKTVYVNALPALGYYTKSISYTTASGNQVVEGGKFVMPNEAVTLKAVFEKTSLEVAINGNATETGSSLKEIIDATYAGNYKDVKEIRVAAGAFTLNEWEWLEENVESLIQLKSFTIDEGVVVDDIPDVANLLVFEGYFSKKTIATVNIAGLRQIGKWVFQDTKEALTEVNLPNVTRVGEEAFAGCAKLSKVSIPNLEEMGMGAFGNTFSLTEVSFPRLKKVPAGAFYSQDASSGQTVFYGILAKVDLPAVEEIGEDAFQSCHHLATIDLPNLKTLGEKAFASCLVLNNIHFDNIEVIPTSAFYSCNKLQNFTFNKAKIIGDGAFGYSYIEDIKDELFPEVTEIGKGAFKENIRVHKEGQVTGLTTVSLSKVIEIKDGAFMNNGALIYANFPALETLGAQVFRNDKLLTTVVLPKVSLIGKGAFVGCQSLKTMILGANPPTLGGETPEDNAKIFECEDCKGRTIVLVDDKGLPLAGATLKTAIDEYKKVKETGKDGKTFGWDEAKKEWYGWKIAEGVHSVSMASTVKNGEITGLPSFYKAGEQVIVTPRASTNYQEVKGSLKAYKQGDQNTKVDFVSDGQGGFLKKFVMPDFDVEVSVEFQPSPFEIKIGKMFDGTITCAGITDLRHIPWGTKVVLEVKPDDGRELTPGSLLVTNATNKEMTVELGADNSFIMPPYNVLISAKFQKESEKKIIILPTENGKIFATPVEAVSGIKVALTIVPSQNYRLKPGSLQVYKQGEPNVTVPVADDYTFIMPKYAVEVKALFDKETDASDSALPHVEVYPVPFNDHIIVSNANYVASYRLVDMSGLVVRHAEHNGTASTLRINTEELQEGVYILQLEILNNRKQLSFRLIKKDLLRK